MRRLSLALYLFLLPTLAGAQELEVSSRWHQAFSGIWLLIPLDGPETNDPMDLHAPGSADIEIQADGQYRIDFKLLVGLGRPIIDPLGAASDRGFTLARIDAAGNFIVLWTTSQARNVTTQVYMGPTSAHSPFELRRGDRLRLFFRYNTPEEYLWIIVPQFRLDRVP